MERGNSISLLDRSRRGKHCAGSVGGICDVPDPILAHILSFLPTKDAVATSILAHRWKFLWTMTSNLDIDCYRYDGVERFVEFVNHVFRLHNPGFLNGFTLSWGYGCMSYFVNVDAWINTALARNVRKLDLYVGNSEFPIHTQRSMFTCESLQSLVLKHNFCISREIAFSLPKLESLELQSAIFESEETLCKLLGGCPVLKDLFLTINIIDTEENCGIAFRCIISSASLRRFVLFAADECGRDQYMSICVQLDAPLLNYIKLYQISSISIRQTPIFLVEADIHVRPDFEEEDHYSSVVEAFRALDHAKKLVLNFEVIRAFKSATIEMKSIFNKLTRLEVSKRLTYWIELHHFLHFSDNLEVLIVLPMCDDVSEEEENLIAAEPNLVPRCLSNRLRLVSIGCYRGEEEEFAMINYILKHASILQLLKFPYLRNDEKVREVIQNLPRKSPVCEFEFY